MITMTTKNHGYNLPIDWIWFDVVALICVCVCFCFVQTCYHINWTRVRSVCVCVWCIATCMYVSNGTKMEQKSEGNNSNLIT